MTQKDFLATLTQANPPPGSNTMLQALWYDARGNWSRAHELVQDDGTADAAWIHAYLHRKEGDISNAGYWYRRAGKKMPEATLEQEWEELVRYFLA